MRPALAPPIRPPVGALLSAPLRLAWWLLAGILVFGWYLTRHVVVPLGLVRTAWAMAWLCELVWRRDRAGGAATAAAWALVRRREWSPALVRFVEARLDALTGLRGGGILAAGLLAAARQDRARARQLLASVEWIDDRACPPEARALAREWRAADAAERGAWHEAAELARLPGPRTPATAFLGVAARRLLGDDIGPAALRMAWLVAPARRETLPLLRRALAAARRDARQREPGPALDAWGRALALHLEVTRGGRPDAATLADLGRAWDEALGDPALVGELNRRALALGARTSEAALAELQRQIEDDLVAAVRPHLDDGLRLDPPSGGLLARALLRLTDELLGEMELACDRLRARAEERRALPIVAEWIELAEIRRAHARAVAAGGMSARRLAFPKLHADVCKLAVWLWNDRRERAVANAMFRFLLDEARAVGDAEAIELQTRNAACGV